MDKRSKAKSSSYSGSQEPDPAKKSVLVKLKVKNGDDAVSDISCDSDWEPPRSIVPVQATRSPLKGKNFSTNLKNNRWVTKIQTKNTVLQCRRNFLGRNTQDATTRKGPLYSTYLDTQEKCTINLVARVNSQVPLKKPSAYTIELSKSKAKSQSKPVQAPPVRTVKITLQKK